MSNRSKLLKRRPRTTTVSFCWDPADTIELKRLRDAVADAQRTVDRPTSKVEDRQALESAEAALAAFMEATPLITWHLTAIGPRKAESIATKHLPNAEQVKAHNEAQEALPVNKRNALTFDPDSYPAALVAKCCTKVVVTGPDGFTEDGDDIDAEVVQEMFDSEGWATDDIGTLFGTAMLLNQAGSGVDRDLVERLGNG